MVEIIEILIGILLLLLIYIVYLYFKLKTQFGTVVADATKNLFDKWKLKELEIEKNKIQELIKKEFEVKFNEWVQEKEKLIREDAIARSANTILGRVGEQFAPIFVFENYGINAKDARFLGSPIDFISFNGLDEENVENISFIEIKSGKTTALTKGEKQIKEIIEKKKVKWVQINLKEELEKAEVKLTGELGEKE